MGKFNETAANMLTKLTRLFTAWGLIDDGFHGHITISIQNGLAVHIKREDNIK